MNTSFTVIDLKREYAAFPHIFEECHIDLEFVHHWALLDSALALSTRFNLPLHNIPTHLNLSTSTCPLEPNHLNIPTSTYLSSIYPPQSTLTSSTLIPTLLADLNNQPVGSSCVTHILPYCGYFKGQEQI